MCSLTHEHKHTHTHRRTHIHPYIQQTRWSIAKAGCAGYHVLISTIRGNPFSHTRFPIPFGLRIPVNFPHNQLIDLRSEMGRNKQHACISHTDTHVKRFCTLRFRQVLPNRPISRPIQQTTNSIVNNGSNDIILPSGCCFPAASIVALSQRERNKMAGIWRLQGIHHINGYNRYRTMENQTTIADCNTSAKWCLSSPHSSCY